MKMMITGRRAPGISFAQMKAHMLNVHGPLVVASPPLLESHFGRYRQNHVIDGIYGTDAPIGRDMVAELEFKPGADPMVLRINPHMREKVHPDEANFAHLSDRTFSPVIEEVVLEPPAPAGRTQTARHFKVIHFLQSADGESGATFHKRWAGVDLPAYQASQPIGYVRNITQPGPSGLPHYSGIAELWFDLETGQERFGLWRDAIVETGLIDVKTSFALFVTEHQIHPAP